MLFSHACRFFKLFLCIASISYIILHIVTISEIWFEVLDILNSIYNYYIGQLLRQEKYLKSILQHKYICVLDIVNWMSLGNSGKFI